MHSATARLVQMANQIARNLPQAPGHDRAIDIADHLDKFWEPRMKKALLAHDAAGGDGLDALTRQAVQHLSGVLVARGVVTGAP